MKRNRIIIATLLFSCAVAANAQNDRDAFRYSMLTPTGTARNTALGGSMGAFGADFSTASTNPAALGTYNRSEFSISPSLYFGSTKIEYNGETYKDYKPNFNLGNIGVVLTIPNDNESANWKAVQISTGINRMGNFNTYGYGCGPNMNGTSFIDYVAADANNKDIYTDDDGIRRYYENGKVKGIECIKMELGEPDASGRRRPVEVPGSEFILDVDSVIMVIGTTPNPLIRTTTEGLEANKRGCLVVDENMKTTKDGVYAGGDAVTGAATVILAMGAGKQAAKAIDEYINSKN